MVVCAWSTTRMNIGLNVATCAVNNYPRCEIGQAEPSWGPAGRHSWRWCVSSVCRYDVASCSSSSAGCRSRRL